MNYIWATINDINWTFSFEFPTSLVELVEIESNFWAKNRYKVLKGYIGAIGRIHFYMENLGKQSF